MNHTFIKGLELSELFYKEAVKPILAKRFPDLNYSAALIGLGSEVLGFDMPQSMVCNSRVLVHPVRGEPVEPSKIPFDKLRANGEISQCCRIISFTRWRRLVFSISMRVSFIIISFSASSN